MFDFIITQDSETSSTTSSVEVLDEDGQGSLQGASAIGESPLKFVLRLPKKNEGEYLLKKLQVHTDYKSDDRKTFGIPGATIVKHAHSGLHMYVYMYTIRVLLGKKITWTLLPTESQRPFVLVLFCCLSKYFCKY